MSVTSYSLCIKTIISIQINKINRNNPNALANTIKGIHTTSQLQATTLQSFKIKNTINVIIHINDKLKDIRTEIFLSELFIG